MVTGADGAHVGAPDRLRPLDRPQCPTLAVSPDGTLVAYDDAAETLTWYEDEPRVVPLTAELPGYGILVAIGPHDIAYFHVPGNVIVAVAPSGAEITRSAVAIERGRRTRQRQASSVDDEPCRWLVGERCAADAVGRPRREPDHRHQALPHGDGHRCRDRGPTRGTGMAARREEAGVRGVWTAWTFAPIRRRSRDGAATRSMTLIGDQPVRAVARRHHRALLRRRADADGSARRLDDRRTRSPTGPPHPSSLTSIPRIIPGRHSLDRRLDRVRQRAHLSPISGGPSPLLTTEADNPLPRSRPRPWPARPPTRGSKRHRPSCSTRGDGP